MSKQCIVKFQAAEASYILRYNNEYSTRPDSPGGPGEPWPTQTFAITIATVASYSFAEM